MFTKEFCRRLLTEHSIHRNFYQRTKTSWPNPIIANPWGSPETTRRVIAVCALFALQGHGQWRSSSVLTWTRREESTWRCGCWGSLGLWDSKASIAAYFAIARCFYRRRVLSCRFSRLHLSALCPFSTRIQSRSITKHITFRSYSFTYTKPMASSSPHVSIMDRFRLPWRIL